MIYGYARVSSKHQNLDIQLEQLKKYGCETIIAEKVSGVAADRELNRLSLSVSDGDSLVVTRMDRLGRNAKELIDLVDKLQEKNVSLIILDMNVDTTTVTGKLFLTIMAGFAEMERKNLKEKQRRGIANRRKKGLHMGRKPKFSNEQMEEAIYQVANTEKTIKEICGATGVSRATLYREIKAREFVR